MNERQSAWKALIGLTLEYLANFKDSGSIESPRQDLKTLDALIGCESLWLSLYATLCVIFIGFTLARRSLAYALVAIMSMIIILWHTVGLTLALKLSAGQDKFSGLGMHVQYMERLSLAFTIAVIVPLASMCIFLVHDEYAQRVSAQQNHDDAVERPVTAAEANVTGNDSGNGNGHSNGINNADMDRQLEKQQRQGSRLVAPLLYLLEMLCILAAPSLFVSSRVWVTIIMCSFHAAILTMFLCASGAVTRGSFRMLIFTAEQRRKRRAKGKCQKNPMHPRLSRMLKSYAGFIYCRLVYASFELGFGPEVKASKVLPVLEMAPIFVFFALCVLVCYGPTYPLPEPKTTEEKGSSSSQQ